MIQQGFNFTNWECLKEYKVTGNSTNCIIEYPGFASNLIFELRHDTEKHADVVMVKYNGEY